MIDSWKALLPDVINIARKAGDAVLQIYATRDLGIEYKADHSPVTKADLAAHQIIKQGLENLPISFPVLSEEGINIPFAIRGQWPAYWLIDPLDGTKEFIHGTDEFTVNVCLINNHLPVMGVVFIPVKQECFWAIRGAQAFWQKPGQDAQCIFIRRVYNAQNKLRIAISRRHGVNKKLQSLLDKIHDYELINCGSALKICLIAKGEADLYPRFGQTAEWDTAAGQCILEAAGGMVLNLAGRELRYNTKDSLVNPEFIATASRAIFDSLF